MFIPQLREVHESEMEKAYQLKAKIIEVQCININLGILSHFVSFINNCRYGVFLMVWYDDLITCASAEGHVILTGTNVCPLRVTSPLSAGVHLLSVGRACKCTH